MRLHIVASLAIALLATAGCDRGGGSTRANLASGASEAARAPSPSADAARKSEALGSGYAAHRSTIAVAQSQAPAPQTPALPATAGAGAADSVPPSMIIRTGDATIEVDSLEAGMAAVRSLAERLGGYLANSSVQVGRERTHSATLQLKIPAARFDEALSGLQPIGKLESTNVVAEDVGEEFVDVSARVANARRLEQRLIELLATRTGKLSDVLAVERELARVRGEIDRNEGRLRYLRTRAAMSTLSVTVHEPVPILGEQGSGGVIAQSFQQSWRNFVGFVAGFIAALGTLVPLAVVLAAVALAAMRLIRRMKPSTNEGAGEGAA